MFVELKFKFKFTNIVKFNDFRDELRLKFRCVFFKRKNSHENRIAWSIQTQKRQSNFEKKKFKISKKVNFFFDIDNSSNENEKFKISKFKNKKINKTQSIKKCFAFSFEVLS